MAIKARQITSVGKLQQVSDPTGVYGFNQSCSYKHDDLGRIQLETIDKARDGDCAAALPIF